ncbi:Peroxisomal biogenesis factor 3 [Yarrowia sp. C11]|nr:Peroxisomal biogenesis factor 3 [Yarrowia sp. E02]KAG5372526.1 Peroxisomal biogenesis factor 3 [Yarrowia sp. C11]
MLQSLNRNKKRLAVSTGLIAVAYVVISYTTKRLIEKQEQKLEEERAKERLKQLFAQTQNEAAFHTASVLPQLCEQIMEFVAVEKIAEQLQNMRAEKRKKQNLEDDKHSVLSLGTETTASMADGSKRSKIQLWDELKIESLTRIVTLIYCVSLLNYLIRLQTNIIGRKRYQNEAGPAGSTYDMSLEQCYTWLLTRGWKSVVDNVRRSVQQVFTGVNPRQNLSLDEFATLLKRVQTLVNSPPYSTTPNTFLTSLLPPRELEQLRLEKDKQSLSPNYTYGSPLKDLVFESAQHIQSPQGMSSFRAIIDQSFKVFLEKVNESQYVNPPSTGGKRIAVGALQPPIISGGPKKVKLASLLSVATRQSSVISHAQPNPYVDAINNVAEYNGLCAVIYSSFEQ